MVFSRGGGLIEGKGKAFVTVGEDDFTGAFFSGDVDRDADQDGVAVVVADFGDGVPCGIVLDVPRRGTLDCHAEGVAGSGDVERVFADG